MEIKSLEDGKENPLSTLRDDGAWLFSLSATQKFNFTDTANAFLIYNDRLQDIRRINIPDHFKGYDAICTLDNYIAIENYWQPEPSSICLIDPLSSWASPARTLPPASQDVDREIMKIVMLGDITFALEGLSGFLSYTAPGMKDWVRLEEFRFKNWLDLISSKKDGLLYLLSVSYDKVISLGLPSSSSPNVEDLERKDVTFNLTDVYDPWAKENQGWACCQNACLVDSPHGVFLVRWRRLSKDGEEHRRDIDVHKLLVNGPDKKWVQTKSLDNQAFFLGNMQSIALSTMDFPKLRSNHIYIHHDAIYPLKRRAENMVQIDPDYFLVHNMEDGTWSQLYDLIDLPHSFGLSVALWMTPPQRKSTLKRKYDKHLETENLETETTTPGERHGNLHH